MSFARNVHSFSKKISCCVHIGYCQCHWRKPLRKPRFGGTGTNSNWLQVRTKPEQPYSYRHRKLLRSPAAPTCRWRLARRARRGGRGWRWPAWPSTWTARSSTPSSCTLRRGTPSSRASASGPTASAAPPGEYVLKRRFQSKRAQRCIRSQLFTSTFR